MQLDIIYLLQKKQISDDGSFKGGNLQLSVRQPEFSSSLNIEEDLICEVLFAFSQILFVFLKLVLL